MVVASGLIAFESSIGVVRTSITSGPLLVGVAVGGLVLSALWLAAAVASYGWLMRWRRDLSRLGEQYRSASSVTPFSKDFDDLRPTFMTAGTAPRRPPLRFICSVLRDLFGSRALAVVRPTLLSFLLAPLFSLASVGLAVLPALRG